MSTVIGGEILTPSQPLEALGWWLADGAISESDVVVAYDANAASYADSKVNLANPGTYDLDDTAAAPGWTADGWTFDGTQYLDTGYVGTADLVASYFVEWSTTSSQANQMMFGKGGVGNEIGVRRTTSSSISFYHQTRTNVSITTSSSTIYTLGVSGSNPVGLDGIFTGDTIDDNVNSNANTIFIGARNNGTADFFFIGTIKKFVAYNRALTQAETSALYAAMRPPEAGSPMGLLLTLTYS